MSSLSRWPVRGCLHCFTCESMPRTWGIAGPAQQHSQEWWPGLIASPSTYFLLGARKLQYLLSHPPSDGPFWRETQFPPTSLLLLRRRHCPLTLLVPAPFTNVKPDDALTYTGTVSILLPAAASRGGGGGGSSCGASLPSSGTYSTSFLSLSSSSTQSRDSPAPRALYQPGSQGSSACQDCTRLSPRAPVKRSRSAVSLASAAAATTGRAGCASSALDRSALDRSALPIQPSLSRPQPPQQPGSQQPASCAGAAGVTVHRAGSRGPFRPPPLPPGLKPMAGSSWRGPAPPHPHHQRHHQHRQWQQQLPLAQAHPPFYSRPYRASCFLPPTTAHPQSCGRAWGLQGHQVVLDVGSPGDLPITQSRWQWQWEGLAAGLKRKVSVV